MDKNLFTAVVRKFEEDINRSEENSLINIVGSKIYSPEFVLQYTPKLDLSRGLPKITYFGSPGPSKLDKKTMHLVIKAHADSYDTVVSIIERVDDLIYKPFTKQGLYSKRISPEGIRIGTILKEKIEDDSFDEALETYERSTEYLIKYVKKDS